MDTPRLYLCLEIQDEFGKPLGRKTIILDDETAVCGDRISTINPPALDASFDDAVHIMKVRQFRRDLLERAATRLSSALADHLEDKEGWHGEERRDRRRALADTDR